MSPRLAKLALTPPVVGLVRYDINNPPASLNFSIAAVVFAICISEKRPSCILAPPLAANIISGSFLFIAYSVSLVIFSPTAIPMLPIRNLLSITATAVLTPPIRHVPVTTASCWPVFNLFASTFFSYPGKLFGLPVLTCAYNSLKLLSSLISAILLDGVRLPSACSSLSLNLLIVPHLFLRFKKMSLIFI